MAIPISSSLIQLNAETFFQEGFELSLDAIVPSIELTGSFTEFKSKTQFYIYDYTKTILYTNLDYTNNGSFLLPELGTSTSPATASVYNQFELSPNEDIYNQGYSNGKFYAVYNFIDYELGSELLNSQPTPDNSDIEFEDVISYRGHPYFIKEISGDRTELRIQNNFLTSQQIETYYNNFKNKLSARQNVDEFYLSFTGNRNFIGINSQLETSSETTTTSILIKLYQPLPTDFELEEELQIITKVGETQVFEVEFNPNLEFIDNLLSLKGPNYNIDIKDKVNNSTNFKSLKDLVNTNSSQSYYQFNSLQDQKGVFLTKNWGDWSEFVKFSSAEQRLNNFYDKMVLIEDYEAELSNLETITGASNATLNYSSSYNSVSNNINKIISKFDSYEYFLYYVTGSESWPKYTSTYPYTNYSVTSSTVLNWFGSTDEDNTYFNTGKNQIYSASRYDENNQDYLYYLIPPYITDNSSNNQYVKFVNMTGQTFDEMYLYTEAVEQVRNTNSGLTGSVLPLGMADDVIESLGFETYGNDFNSIGFNVNGIGVFPATGSGLEYIDRYIDIASGSVINYYDQDQSTLGYVIALSDPSFPYPLDNAAQEIYKRIFHNMVSLVKRKGTVTGLRQLINIWGVPNTMLRISEFGGKNKDDKNDYDLWMNRYSNALTTYDYKKGALSPSGSIRIPWTPLTGNYYETAAVPDIAVPDCIQFRFKTAEPITATSNFSQSLLVKNSSNSGGFSDFGITLHYSGSQSGSYSGSVLPTTSQYGNLSFRISASGAGGYRESTPISLPFFNDDWWSVQLQRKTHISASNQDNTNNEFELRVANNIYDGYDGNQIGFQGVSTITTVGNNGVNEAWNRFANDAALPSSRGIMLGGYMSATADYNKLIGPTSIVGGSTAGIGLGDSFSGSFQEFRYYRRALSSSQFNDYVMNPESIQGHEDSNTGEGSSYDLLSFRLPLGNELEYTDVTGSAGVTLGSVEDGGAVGIFKFGGTPDIISFPSFGGSALGSLHPSLVNKKGTLYTSSFLYMTGYNTGSGYSIVYAGSDGTYTTSLTSSYLEPNTQINYMDQPAAGIRNRIKNKIQVIDGNEYGTTLSPFRSIQQEFEQSASYTEDLNSLEVGFSFQNEINDDIIATFGHGVVSDAIADPRFISESSDRYPELTRIANDYFKKYQGITINDPRYTGLPTIIEKEYDYNRLIKFYETSLFKAIKNYVPARTSLSTGIIVKQHLLERNKTDAVIGMHTQTPVAKTPETGSNSFGATTQTGFNSIMSQQNLLITSSIGMYSLTGSAGGSVNKYNIITNEGQYYQSENDDVPSTSPNTFVILFPDLNPSSGQTENNIFLNEDSNGEIYLESTVAFRSQIRFNPYLAVAPAAPGVEFTIQITSSERGGIFTNTFPVQTAINPPSLLSENYVDVYPNERLYVYIACDVLDTGGNNIVIDGFAFEIGEGDDFDKPEPKASQQVNWYIDDFTGEYKVDDHQTEFYNGEYSGSNVPMIPAQYNPYRIFADGNNQTPDSLPPFIDFNLGGGNPDYWDVISSDTIEFKSGYPGTATFKYWTGSLHNLTPGGTYKLTYTITNKSSGLSNLGIVYNDPVAGSISWGGFAGQNANGTFTKIFVATDDRVSGIGDSGGVYMYASPAGEDATIQFNSIVGLDSLGPKHFYERDGFTIVPSASQLFQASPYNPLLNNVSSSRKNSFLFDQDFDPVSPGFELKEGIPNDYALTISASQLGWEGTATNENLLEYSEVPDSNYTTKAIINPRYIGCLLESADYNFYTGIPSESLAIGRSTDTGITGLANPPFLLTQNKVQYINGETGSWTGDTSYGKNAVISRNPINIAHFKSSLESKEYFGTTTFNIDQLIQIPFEEILNEQSPIITSSLINGSNENLIAMSSTFMPGREATIVYNQTNKTFNNVGGTILNYTNLGIGSNTIYAGGSNFEMFSTNELKLDILTTIQYYDLPIWYNYGIATSSQTSGTGGENPNIAATPNSQSLLLSGSYYGVGLGLIPFTTSASFFTPFENNLFSITGGSTDPFNNTFYTGATNGVVMAYTGSRKDENNRDIGVLNLKGPLAPTYPGMFYTQTSAGSDRVRGIRGTTLSVFNSWNNLLKLGDINPLISSSNNTATPQPLEQQRDTSAPILPCSKPIIGTYGLEIGPGSLPVLTPTEVNNNQNYYRFNRSGSMVLEYRDFEDQKILIEPGDEIRVSYAYYVNENNQGTLNKTFQDFTVLSYDQCAPAIYTLPIKAADFDAQTAVSFSVAVVGANTSGTVVPKRPYLSNFPESGYYNFGSMLNKYKVAMNNGDIYSLGIHTGGGTIYNSSGSITGVNSYNEVNGTGIIGVTMSLNGDNHSQYVDDTNLVFGTNYTMQAGDTTQQNTEMKKVGFVSPVLDINGVNHNTSQGLPIDPGYLFDRVVVTPNPNDLNIPIPSGRIFAMTLRKRVEADDRVILNVNQPSGSAGALTLSGDGYLIPNDITEVQQRNVQKIINKLKSENVFTQDSPDNLGGSSA